MGNIDILTLEPTTISRDLKNKFMLIYGLPKVGKTSFAAEFPRNLLLAFEKGYNAISSLRVVDIPTWTVFKDILKQLRTSEAKEMYDSITLDTVGIAWSLCEKYICKRENVGDLSEVAWGKAFAMCTREFEETLREITLLGYGLIFISHSEEKPVKTGSDETIIRPAIPRRAYDVVNRIVDIIGYIAVEFDEEGNSTRILYTRSTPGIVAGSRFRYMKNKISFGYNELVTALTDAIEEEGKHGAKLSDERHAQYIEDNSNETKFKEVMDKARGMWFTAADKDLIDQAMSVIEKHFGRKMKLSEATEEQIGLVESVIVDLETLIA
jgi:hypothetical protein